MDKSILLKNITAGGRVCDILIRGNRIADIREASEGGLVETCHETETVDCTGKTAFPGLINMHTHAGMTMMKGIGEDMTLQKWLDMIWQVEEHIDEEYVYHATKLACLEMIFRRPVSAKILQPLTIVFVVILIGFMIFVTIFDIQRLLPAEAEQRGKIIDESNMKQEEKAKPVEKKEIPQMRALPETGKDAAK